MMAAIKPVQTLVPLATRAITPSAPATPRPATPAAAVTPRVVIRRTAAPEIRWPSATDRAQSRLAVERTAQSAQRQTRAAQAALKTTRVKARRAKAERVDEAGDQRAAIIATRDAAIADQRAALAEDSAELRVRLAAAGVMDSGSAAARLGAMADATTAETTAARTAAAGDLAAIRKHLEAARRDDLLDLAEARRRLRLSEATGRQAVAQTRRQEDLRLQALYDRAMIQWRAARRAHAQALRDARRLRGNSGGQ